MSLTGFNRRRREIAALKIAEKKEQETVKVTEAPKVEVKEEPKVDLLLKKFQEEKPAVKKASKK